ncbi:MAG: helix-turn-helix transcriptional regulator [Eggerthellaceae bacterium]|jgi:AraC-like DNA-binding protein
MQRSVIDGAIDKLGREFAHLNWDFRPDPSSGGNEVISQWLGGEDEDVMLCVFKGAHIHERFHRQDFFFLNFALQGDYQALSARYDRQITVRQGDCYIGQPYSGYALRGNSATDIIIAGILIRRQTFFNEYLAPLSESPDFLRFFLEPQINSHADEYLQLPIAPDDPLWPLLDIMLVEYSQKRQDTQQVLKPLIVSLMMFLSRTYRAQHASTQTTPAGRMMAFIEEHLESVTLSDLAEHFGYHPNYVSGLLHRETGQTFSEILRGKRLERATLLMSRTDLPLEKIAAMVGFRNPSNFYKTFRASYGCSPRSWQHRAAEHPDQ